MGKPAGPPAPRRAPQAGLRCRHLIPAARSHGSKRRSARTGSEVAMGQLQGLGGQFEGLLRFRWARSWGDGLGGGGLGKS